MSAWDGATSDIWKRSVGAGWVDHIYETNFRERDEEHRMQTGKDLPEWARLVRCVMLYEQMRSFIIANKEGR